MDTSYATTDGGRTWTSASMPGTFRAYDLQCPSPEDCVSTGEAPGTYDVTNPNGPDGFANSGAAAYTTDGGRSWKRGSVPSPQSMVTGLSCSNASHCMALNGNDPTVAVFTDNGGSSWTTSSIDRSTTLSLHATACPSSVDCWATGDDVPDGVRPSSGEFSPVIFATTDGGVTWSSSALPPTQGATATSVGRISCPSTTECRALEYRSVPGSSTNRVVLLTYRASSSGPSGRSA